MKKLLLSTLTIGYLFASTPNANTNNNTDILLKNLTKEVNVLNKKIKTLNKQVKRNKRKIKISERKFIRTRVKLNPIFTNSHLYLQYDLRTTGDYIHYKLNTGKKYTNNVFTNRVLLTGVSRPSNNLKATVVLEANNIFGMNSENQYSPYQNIAWVTNETPDDTNIRLKEAFFNYTFGPNNGLLFSAGRRPATEGYPMNLEYGDSPNSPLAHLVNMEFDGFSFLISNNVLDKIIPGIGQYGTNIKFCAGRGYSSSVGKFPVNNTPAYSKNKLGISDFAGFLLVPYDNGQFSIWSEDIWAWNLKGYNKTGQMDNLGDYFGSDLTFKFKGFGDGSNMFLFNTNAFIDIAYSKTMPYSGKQMQGTQNSKDGLSIWIGAQMPGLGSNDTFGLNYIHGSKYFRAMDYGEDTLIGSMASVRGNAYDIYYNRQIIPHLTAGLRATYINYNNSGSDGFFGISSDPNQPVYVDRAYDIRAYIRYKF